MSRMSRKLILARKWLAGGVRVNSDDNRSNTLYAFIDLDVCPITFDFVEFLMLACLDQRKYGLKDIHVVIVPGSKNGFKQEDQEFGTAFDHHSLNWRLHNLCIPILGLVDSVSGYTMCSSRAQAKKMWNMANHVSPTEYSVQIPQIPSRRAIMDRSLKGESLQPFINIPEQAIRYASHWIKKLAGERRVVCINLRSSAYQPERNSNLSAWLDLARKLDPDIFHPVFIRDTDQAMSRDEITASGFSVLDAASWNVWLRAAIFELSWLTVGTLSGPTELCWYNPKCRYLFFSANEVQSEERLELGQEMGFDYDENFHFANAFQRVVWSGDHTNLVAREFDKICEVIDANEQKEADQRVCS